MEQNNSNIPQKMDYELTNDTNLSQEINKKTTLPTIWVALFFPACLFALGASFIGDAPGSENSIVTKMLAISSLLTPIFLLIGAIGGSNTKNSSSNIKKIVYLPFITIALSIIAIILNIVVCHGKFVCWL